MLINQKLNSILFGAQDKTDQYTFINTLKKGYKLKSKLLKQNLTLGSTQKEFSFSLNLIFLVGIP